MSNLLLKNLKKLESKDIFIQKHITTIEYLSLDEKERIRYSKLNILKKYLKSLLIGFEDVIKKKINKKGGNKSKKKQNLKVKNKYSKKKLKGGMMNPQDKAFLTHYYSFLKKVLITDDEVYEIIKERLSECPICLDNQKNYIILVCGHCICNNCLFTLKQNTTTTEKKCPLCRTNLEESKVNLLTHPFTNFKHIVSNDLNYSKYLELIYFYKNMKFMLGSFKERKSRIHGILLTTEYSYEDEIAELDTPEFIRHRGWHEPDWITEDEYSYMERQAQINDFIEHINSKKKFFLCWYFILSIILSYLFT